MEAYFRCGSTDKAIALAHDLTDELIKGIVYFSNPGGEVINQKFVDDQISLFYYIVDVLEQNDQKETAEFLHKNLYVAMQQNQ